MHLIALKDMMQTKTIVHKVKKRYSHKWNGSMVQQGNLRCETMYQYN